MSRFGAGDGLNAVEAVPEREGRGGFAVTDHLRLGFELGEGQFLAGNLCTFCLQDRCDPVCSGCVFGRSGPVVRKISVTLYKSISGRGV